MDLDYTLDFPSNPAWITLTMDSTSFYPGIEIGFSVPSNLANGEYSFAIITED